MLSSTPFADELDTLPTVAEELQFHAVGCYTAVSELKHTYRQAENKLMLAERMATAAELWLQRPFPRTTFHDLWHALSFNQFHDTLGGSSIKEAEDDSLRELGGIIAASDHLVDDAGRAIAASIDTSGPGGCVVVFNLFAQVTHQYVEYEPWTEWQSWTEGNWSLVDDHDRPVPYQLIETHEALSHPNSHLNRIVFPVEIPPFGYRTFRFAPDLPQADLSQFVTTNGAIAVESILENRYLRVKIDPAYGNIVSCVEKQNGIELVGEGGWNVAQVIDDESDTWSHDVRSYGLPSGFFGDTVVRTIDTGPLQASIIVERSYLGSKWQQQIVLRHDERHLLVRNWLDWQGEFKMIKLCCNVAVQQPTATHDIAYGWCERPTDSMEVPTHMWMDVSGPSTEDGQQVGLAVLNDGRYGCDVDGTTMRLTILRSSPYAYHRPHSRGSKHRYDWIDQGHHEFTVIYRPHVGDWKDGDVIQQARELNMALPLITTHAHDGDAPLQNSLLALTSTEMELTAVKPAEDGNGYIVRLLDRYGNGASGELLWKGQSLPVNVEPFSVVTLRLTESDGVWSISACDMLEREL